MAPDLPAHRCMILRSGGCGRQSERWGTGAIFRTLVPAITTTCERERMDQSFTPGTTHLPDLPEAR